ncbi:MAG TPA: flagellar motor switch phosphatase FliY [Firmicutes bacterium]|nr:flagellar motor switch phosphatase FliY [Bacillota bacterium]
MSDELMSQDELDALLAELDNGGEKAKEEKTEFPDLDVNDFLTTEEQDTLAEIGNISMGSAATALSTLVNKKVSITVPEVYMSTPKVVTDSYPVPCIIVNVEYLQGLLGENILVIREKDALVIGSLMMGEDGTSLPPEIDDIYLSALTEAMNMMMGSAATAMSDLFGTLIEISPPTTERRDLAQDLVTEEIPQENPVVTIAFRIEIDGLVDSTMLQIIETDFAKEMVEMLLPAQEEVPKPAAIEEEAAAIAWADLKEEPAKMPPPPRPVQKEDQTAVDLGNINIDLIKGIPVQVRAVLGRTKMSIDNILRLGPGHIMELESFHGEPIEVFANDTLIARGEVVVVGEQFGVRITEIATQKDRIVSVS